MAKYGEHSSAWELGQLGGRGGPWPGPLAAGEGEGSPGGGYKDSQGEKWDHCPFRCLLGTCKIHFLGILVWAEASTQGRTGDPHPTQPRTAHVCKHAVWGSPE